MDSVGRIVARWPRGRVWEWRSFAAVLLIVDAISLAVAFAVAAALYSGRSGTAPEGPAWAAVSLIPLLLLLFCTQGLYERRYLFGGPGEYGRVVTGCTFGVLALVGTSYFAEGAPLVSRGWLLVSWSLSMVFVSVARFALRRVVYWLRRRGHFIQRALIAGVDKRTVAIARQLRASQAHGVEIVGFLDDFLTPGSVVIAALPYCPPLAVLGPAHDARHIASQHAADLLIVNSQALPSESFQRLLLDAATQRNVYEVRLVALPYDLLAVAVEATSLGYVPLLRIEPHRITGADAVLRRAFDLAVAIPALLVGLPLVALLLLGARLRGIWPVVEHRQIYGRLGQPVDLVLLRPEVTRRILLRGWPALWSVLVGRVSIVGPRPRRLAEPGAEQSLAMILAVEPGLTGPWRVMDREGVASQEDQRAQEIWYIRNYTIWQDLFWVWQSICALLPHDSRAPVPRLRRWEQEEVELPAEAWRGGPMEMASAGGVP